MLWKGGEEDLRSGPTAPMVAHGNLAGANDLVNELQVSNQGASESG